MPVFTATNDLHLVPVMNAQLDNLGTPVTGITTDIDGQVRNATTPDMGADEFTAPNCTSAVGGTIAPASYNLCNGQSLSITSNSVSMGASTIYQWMSATTPGGPYTNVTGGTGANTSSYVSPALTTGTLYYVLQVTCSVASLTAVSNEATVTINPVPTASITSNSPLCAGQTLSLSGASDIGTSYTWAGPNGFTSSSQNPVIPNATITTSGNYTLIVSTSNCTAAAVATSVTVNTTNMSIVAPASACMGSTYTLNTSGTASTYTWNTGANTSSIVVSPTITTTYSVAGTGTNNCMASASVVLTVVNPTISGIGAIACGSPATSTLSVNAFTPSIVNWYASPTSTVSLGTGTAFVPTATTTSTTYYAEANSSGSSTLQTTLIGGNGSNGTMFDIVALNSITIDGFDMNINGTTTSTVEVWYRVGSYQTFTASNTGWTQVLTTTVTGMGSGNLTPVPSTLNVTIPAGQTYAFFVTTNGGPTSRYTNGTAVGNIYASNSDLQLLEGAGGAYFNVSFSPRIFNGQVRYSKAGCTSSKIPVTLTVNPQPTVTASASSGSVCAGNSLTLTASGATSYSWSSGASGSVTVVNPTSNTTYTVTGTDNGCSKDTVIAVNVTALPGVTVTSSQTMVCVNGSTVSLTGTPSGGVYSGTNVSGSVFTPASSGTFSPAYSYTDAVTGCSNSASASIIVSSCTGVESKTNGSAIAVYPNPTSGAITVEFAGNDEKVLEVTDLTGRVILSEKTNLGKYTINLTGYANGVYFIKIKTGEVNQVIKVVKQ
jgi:hypothetical protein